MMKARIDPLLPPNPSLPTASFLLLPNLRIGGAVNCANQRLREGPRRREAECLPVPPAAGAAECQRPLHDLYLSVVPVPTVPPLPSPLRRSPDSAEL